MRIATFIALLFFLFSSSTIFNSGIKAYSCPSKRLGPPCQEFWDADAVFIALATKVTHIPNNLQVL